MEKKRNYGLDLLKIICMLMIIGLHYVYNCGIDNVTNFGINYIFIWVLEAICYVSVDCFVFITGYFGIKNERINYKRIVSLIIRTWFYSLMFLIIFVFYKKNISFSNIYTSIFPIITGQYWFITCYLLLVMVQPILNKIIKEYNEKLLKIIKVLLIVFCVIPSVFPFSDQNIKLVGGTGFIWFIILYLVGAYIRINENNFKKNKNIIMFFSFILPPVIIKLLMKYLFNIDRGGAVFYHHNNIFIFLAALNIFIFMKNINIKKKLYKKFIEIFSISTFGVYLIHENVFLKRELWGGIEKLQDVNSIFMPIYIIFTIMTIFFASSLVETIRKKVFILLDIDNKFYEMILKLYNNFRKEKQ